MLLDDASWHTFIISITGSSLLQCCACLLSLLLLRRIHIPHVNARWRASRMMQKSKLVWFLRGFDASWRVSTCARCEWVFRLYASTVNWSRWAIFSHTKHHRCSQYEARGRRSTSCECDLRLVKETDSICGLIICIYFTSFKPLTCQICAYFREYAREITLIRSLFYSPKCSKYRSAAELRSDPLGELTALP